MNLAPHEMEKDGINSNNFDEANEIIANFNNSDPSTQHRIKSLVLGSKASGQNLSVTDESISSPYKKVRTTSGAGQGLKRTLSPGQNGNIIDNIGAKLLQQQQQRQQTNNNNNNNNDIMAARAAVSSASTSTQSLAGIAAGGLLSGATTPFGGTAATTTTTNGRGNRHRRPYGLLLKHNVPVSILEKQADLIRVVLAQKPDNCNIDEIKRTRKDDILIVGKKEEDLNRLIKRERWKDGPYKLIPLLPFADNTARAVYFKDVDADTNPDDFIKILGDMGIAQSNTDRVTVGQDRRITKTIRSLIHMESDIQRLEKEGVLIKYRRYIPERHVKVSVKQCFKCGKFGHLQTSCTNDAKCLYCGGDHEKKDCNSLTNAIKCLNCNEAHAASFKGCSAWLKEHRVQRSKKFSSYAAALGTNSSSSGVAAAPTTINASQQQQQQQQQQQRSQVSHIKTAAQSDVSKKTATDLAMLNLNICLGLFSIFAGNDEIIDRKTEILDVVIRSVSDMSNDINAGKFVESAFEFLNNKATTGNDAPQSNLHNAAARKTMTPRRKGKRNNGQQTPRMNLVASASAKSGPNLASTTTSETSASAALNTGGISTASSMLLGPLAMAQPLPQTAPASTTTITTAMGSTKMTAANGLAASLPTHVNQTEKQLFAFTGTNSAPAQLQNGASTMTGVAAAVSSHQGATQMALPATSGSRTSLSSTHPLPETSANASVIYIPQHMMQSTALAAHPLLQQQQHQLVFQQQPLTFQQHLPLQTQQHPQQQHLQQPPATTDVTSSGILQVRPNGTS